jgi:hypothetical protein
VALGAIIVSFANAEVCVILKGARQKLATDATQAAGVNRTVLTLRGVTERKQLKMGGDDETDV